MSLVVTQRWIGRQVDGRRSGRLIVVDIENVDRIAGHVQGRPVRDFVSFVANSGLPLLPAFLGVLAFRAVASGSFFQQDADLALKEELRAIGVFEDLGFAAGLEIAGVVEVLEQISILSAAVLIEKLGAIVSMAIIDVAGVDEDAKDVGGLGIASPFMVDGVANVCELDWTAGWVLQDLNGREP